MEASAGAVNHIMTVPGQKFHDFSSCRYLGTCIDSVRRSNSSATVNHACCNLLMHIRVVIKPDAAPWHIGRYIALEHLAVSMHERDTITPQTQGGVS